jgi:UDP-N-acetylmuramyl tripeptide synthase
VFYVALLFGKLAKFATKLRKTGGSAFPGLVAEKIYPPLLKEILAGTPVILITGTNGKTTTTKIVTELLEGFGKTVFTNSTGSNFPRGILSELLNLKNVRDFNYNFAVLELDEAWAARFVEKVQPDYSLLLNVFRDQLDRFGEINTTARYLKEVALATKKKVVSNANDKMVRSLGTVHFGFNPALSSHFPNDDELYMLSKKDQEKISSCNVRLNEINDDKVKFNIGSAKLKLSGNHNALNSAAALSIVSTVLSDEFNKKKALTILESIEPAFGRGEKVGLRNGNVQLILVKNPAGFRTALESQLSENGSVMIAINDDYADGRDVSWLWDVDVLPLKKVKMVSGTRAYDMALRLDCARVSYEYVNDNLVQALEGFLNVNGDKQIFCTYTAMLKIRSLLEKRATMKKVL